MAPPLVKQSGPWAQIGFYASLGFIIPSAAGVGCFFGWYLDERLHTLPLFVVLLGFLGAAGGFVEVLRLLTRAEKRESGSDSNSGRGQGDGEG